MHCQGFHDRARYTPHGWVHGSENENQNERALKDDENKLPEFISIVELCERWWWRMKLYSVLIFMELRIIKLGFNEK